MSEFRELNVFDDVVVEVYEDGRIKTKDHHHRIKVDGRPDNRKGKFLTPGIDKNGYERIVLTRNGKRKTFMVHRLVAEAYVDNPKNKPTVNHLNGIKDDNRADNLEWATHSEQKKHAIELGLTKNNERVLSEANKRRSIRVLFEGREFSSLREAARKTGFSRTYINKRGVRL